MKVLDHTPAPWHVYRDVEQNGAYCVGELADEEEAWVNDDGEMSDEERNRRMDISGLHSECNRLIIQSTPELWRIVRALSKRNVHGDPLVRDARRIVRDIEDLARMITVGRE
ncbi:MAG: hypothetical protein ACE15C_10140 [Phycisphaerae bacterium]